jgi:hypothetical protein
METSDEEAEAGKLDLDGERQGVTSMQVAGYVGWRHQNAEWNRSVASDLVLDGECFAIRPKFENLEGAVVASRHLERNQKCNNSTHLLLDSNVIVRGRNDAAPTRFPAPIFVVANVCLSVTRSEEYSAAKADYS